MFLAQGRRYEAAQEFEWAKKLLPGHPDPCLHGWLADIALRGEDALWRIWATSHVSH